MSCTLWLHSIQCARTSTAARSGPYSVLVCVRLQDNLVGAHASPGGDWHGGEVEAATPSTAQRLVARCCTGAQTYACLMALASVLSSPDSVFLETIECHT